MKPELVIYRSKDGDVQLSVQLEREETVAKNQLVQKESGHFDVDTLSFLYEGDDSTPVKPLLCMLNSDGFFLFRGAA